jgi:hypothetical protein
VTELLAFLGSLAGQILQKSDGPTEETLCFSVVPIGVALLYFAWRARRWRDAEAAGLD